MKLATEPHSGQPALEHALDALAQLVRARHRPRKARANHAANSALEDAELVELAQASLWAAVDRALQREPRVSALFPSLQRLPDARREELSSDVHGVQRALEHWRSEPRHDHPPEARTRAVHDEELGLLLTTAAHAEGFHALAAWVCGADALEELELVLATLLAHVGVLASEPLSAGHHEVLAALVSDSRTQWSGPAPRRSPVPAPSTSINTAPSSPLAKASRAAAVSSRLESNTSKVAPKRERRLVLSATLAALVLLTLGVVSWAQNRGNTGDASRSPSAATHTSRSVAGSQAPAPQQRVRIYSRPTRAELYLDGRFIGLTPLELERAAAAGLLRLTLAGYPEIEERIDLRASRNSVLVFELGRDGTPIK
ncbi:MAG TPA: PEGA domain-containing protein [Polyangiales bacterium]